MNQLYVYIYPHIPSLLRLPPTLPILPLIGILNTIIPDKDFSLFNRLSLYYMPGSRNPKVRHRPCLQGVPNLVVRVDW